MTPQQCFAWSSWAPASTRCSPRSASPPSTGAPLGALALQLHAGPAFRLDSAVMSHEQSHSLMSVTFSACVHHEISCAEGCVGNDRSLLRVRRRRLGPGGPPAVQRKAVAASSRAGLRSGIPWEAQPQPERQQSEELDGFAEGKCRHVCANLLVAHNMARSMCHYHKDWGGSFGYNCPARHCLGVG